MTSPWATLSGVRVGGGRPVLVMGVLNVSPESFHGGSVYSERSALVGAARRIVEGGSGRRGAGGAGGVGGGGGGGVGGGGGGGGRGAGAPPLPPGDQR